MPNINEHTLTEAVLQTINSDNPRTQRIMTALVKHLHAFIREIEPTEEELMAGIDLLTRTGQMCTAQRQEFVLISDALGASTLIDAIKDLRKDGAL